MGVNLAELAHAVHAAVKCDPVAQGKIRAEFSSLAVSIANDPNASARVTSATINGQTFSSQPTMTQGERLKMLRWVVACLDNGSPISTTQLTTF